MWGKIENKFKPCILKRYWFVTEKFSIGVNFLCLRIFANVGDIYCYSNCSREYDIYWTVIKNATNILTIHKTGCTTNNCCVIVEVLCGIGIRGLLFF